MIQLKYKTNSLCIANVTKRTFGTKFSAGDGSLPITPDHEKKRIVSVAGRRAFTEQKYKEMKIPFSVPHRKTKHSFHLVDPSPWPLAASLGVFMLTTGSVLYTQKLICGFLLSLIGLILIIFVMLTWWRDIIREGAFVVKHNQILIFITCLTIIFVSGFCFSCIDTGLDTASLSTDNIKNYITVLTRILNSLSKKNSLKMRGKNIIPDNAEGFAVYVAIYFVIWLSIEYILYRLEQQDQSQGDESSESDDF